MKKIDIFTIIFFFHLSCPSELCNKLKYLTRYYHECKCLSLLMRAKLNEWELWNHMRCIFY